MQVQHSRITKINAVSNANNKNTLIYNFSKLSAAKNSLTNSKIPRQFPDIPVKTEIPNIPWFSRKWESRSFCQLTVDPLNCSSQAWDYLSP